MICILDIVGKSFYSLVVFMNNFNCFTQNLAAGVSVPPFFTLLTLVLSSVVVVSLFFSRFKQSLLVGYFLCGLILSNSGALEWAGVADVGLVHSLSEVGIVLLLFTIGIEFSIKELKALKRAFLMGGGVQVGLCILLTVVLGWIFNLSWEVALILGFMLSLSSTAVSLKTFQDLGLPESPQGKTTLGIAIFQDLAAILFMILVPAIASSSGGDEVGLVSALLKGILFTVGMLALSKFGLPQILDAVAQTNSRELFTVTVIGLCAAVAMVSGVLGLSPALGAFAAGVVVSESIYSHRVLSDVLPFKDLFLTIFFVSVGLLIDLEVVMSQWVIITIISLGIILLKGAIVLISARLAGLQTGRALLVSAALCSTGEFSIVILNRAMDFELFDGKWEQIILATTALSMAIVPSLMKSMIPFSSRIRNLKDEIKAAHERSLSIADQISHLEDHVIICGYGPVGQNLHQNLEAHHIPVVILELNPKTVKHLIAKGHLALFGDAKDAESLDLVAIQKARGIALTFPDKDLAVAAASLAREKKSDILMYARCKFKADLPAYEAAKINHILLDEEQSGRAMIKSVMQCYSTEFNERWI